MDRLAANPYLTIKGAAEQLGIAFTTAQRAIERLESLSIVEEISQVRRDRVYCATRLMTILEAPARWIGPEMR